MGNFFYALKKCVINGWILISIFIVFFFYAFNVYTILLQVLLLYFYLYQFENIIDR